MGRRIWLVWAAKWDGKESAVFIFSGCVKYWSPIASFVARSYWLSIAWLFFGEVE